MRGFIGILVLACLSALASCEKEKTGGSTTQPFITIAVIPKGTTQLFWNSVQAGAEKAAADSGSR